MILDLNLVIQLQDMDSRISELRHEIASLPKHIAQIEKALESHIRKVEADRATLSANQRERDQLELEVQSLEQKISKLKDQQFQVRTNEQFAAFKREIEYCQNTIRQHEDRILDRMGEAEALERNVTSAQADLSRERRQVEAEQQQARQRTDEDQKALAELERQRREAVAALSPEVYAAYERIHKRRKGLAVAEAVDGRCSACHLALRLQFFQDVKRGDQVMFCHSCGCILYYNPPPEAEELGSPSAQEAQAAEANPSA